MKKIMKIFPICFVFFLFNTTFAEEHVDVMTYNINFDRESWDEGRGELVIEKIADHNADIVGLQEAGSAQKRDIIRRLGDIYELIEFDASDPNADRDSVLIKYDRLEALAYGSIPIPVECAGGSITPHVNWIHILDKETHKNFLFYNNHFCPGRRTTPRPTAKEMHAIVLSEAIEEHQDEFGLIPAIAVGDFNASRRSTPLEFLIDQVPILRYENDVPLVDTWETVFPNRRKPPTLVNGRGSIDWVLVTPSLVDIIDAEVDDSELGLSDHFPVIARVEIY